MKKAKLFLILTCIVIFSSCKKLFKEDELNVYTINSVEELENLAAGLYQSFADSYISSGTALFGNADDVVTYQDGALYYIEKIYTYYYKTIVCSNDLIRKSRGLKSVRVNHLLGEIYFIRAYSYFILARSFGQPPLVYDTDINYTLKKPGYAEVYDSIEADLKRAMVLLPYTFIESRIKYITPHRGTAKALLAEVYLYRGGYPIKDSSAYKKAWQIAGEVIDSSVFYYFDLLPDFVNLWDGRHDMNPESVFSFLILKRGGGMYGWVKPRKYKTKSDSLATLPEYKNVMILDENIPWDGSPGVKFFNTYPPSYRKDNTYQAKKIIRNYGDSIGTIIYDGHIYTIYRITTDTVIFKKIKTSDDMPMKKYYSSVDSMEPYGGIGFPKSINTNTGIYYTGNVFYAIRYAHTLLTYAEARARDGAIDASAFEAVNRIKRRAYHVDLNTPSINDLKPGMETSAFIDSVVWERALEFCGEPGNRWFDIVRTEQIGKIPSLVKPLNPFPFPFNRSTNFFDLPPVDKNLNPGLYN